MRLAIVGLGLLALGTTAQAAEPVKLVFQTHARFFSGESKQPAVIDPQVFVKDEGSPAATGPQGIKHAAGLRPALVERDHAPTPLFNADGKPLGFTLGRWLAPQGTATITPAPGGGDTVAIRLRGLRPNAQYSVFENHFDQTPVTFTPLDGAGVKNGFRTNRRGVGSLTVHTPAAVTHDNAVLVIYDSDGQTHGMSRGDIGVDAHHQAIARPPAS